MPKLTKRTLFQALADAGFTSQKEFVEASKRFDGGVHQPALSAMLRGSPGYPLARSQVAKTLKCSEDDVLAMIANSAKAQATKVSPK